MNNAISVPRLYPPCQGWIYYKLYSGHKTLELFLLNELNDLVSEMKKKQLIDRFFFIRYSDPDPHLRVRFHLTRQSNLNKVLMTINSALARYTSSRIIRNVVIDTYSREIERYGQYCILFAEKLFDIDSYVIMKHLKQYPGKRWLISIAICNLYFNLFGLNDDQRIGFCSSLFESYSKEFNYSKRTKMALDNKFRLYNQELSDALLLTDDKFFNSELIKFYESEASPVIYQIKGILQLKNEVPISELLSSILHMHFNRLFKNQQRMQEFVVYYFLNKLYKSIKARKFINAKPDGISELYSI